MLQVQDAYLAILILSFVLLDKSQTLQVQAVFLTMMVVIMVVMKQVVEKQILQGQAQVEQVLGWDRETIQKQ